MVIRLALRNLLRNRWRSGLTLGGILAATALIIWMEGFMGATFHQMVRSVTALELGDAQIHTEAYVDEPLIHNTFALDDATLDGIAATPGVAGAAPRVQAFGLVGNEERSVVARVIGVDPRREARVTELGQKTTHGRWLAATPAEIPGPREVVIGAAMARQLRVKVGDQLVVFMSAADGSMGNDLLEVVGVLSSGNQSLDRMGAFMHLGDVQYLTALEGRVHEVSLKAEPPDAVEPMVAALGAHLAGRRGADESPLIPRGWRQIVPELAQMLELSSRSMWIMYSIVFLLAGLGILNTQRMSALERRREFGVLQAVGTTPGLMARMVIAEGVVLCMLGGLLGVVVGGGLTWYFSVYGLEMGDRGFSWGGVDFGTRLYFLASPSGLWMPFAVVAGMGLVTGLWPALKSARLDLVRAISGRA